MLFTENRYDRSMEQMMKGIPNFYPRGSGIVVTGNFHYTAEMCDCEYCGYYGGKKKRCLVPKCVCISDCSVLNVSTRKAYTDDESIDELSIIQDFLCVLSSAFIDGRKAPLEKVSAFEIYESLKTNSSPEAKDISPKIRFNINHNGEETSYEFSSDGLKHLDDELFERTEPDEKLYPRYYKAINDPLASLGAVVVRNSTGTDYQLIPFSKMIDNGLSDEADPVFRRIKDADKSSFSPATEAEKYKTVFRVSTSAFNEKTRS